MESALFTLQAEGNEVDTLVLIIEPGIGGVRGCGGRAWWE